MYGTYGTVIETEWWLMTAALPDLNWARLSVFHDNTARVLHSDGRRLYFASDVDAREHLAGCQFAPASNLPDAGPSPAGGSAAELLPQMYVRAGEAPARPGAGFTVKRRGRRRRRGGSRRRRAGAETGD